MVNQATGRADSWWGAFVERYLRKQRAVRAGLLSFVPSDVAGMWVWCDATGMLYSEGTPSDGGPMDEWRNRVSPDDGFAETTALYQPRYVVDGVKSGVPCLRFASVESGMTGLTGLGAPFTLFVVHKNTGGGGYVGRVVQGAGTNWYVGVNVTKYAYFDGATMVDGCLSAGGGWVVQTMVQAPTWCRHYVNGVRVGSSNVAGVDPGTIALSGRGAWYAENFVGDMAAFLLWPKVLGCVERFKIENFLLRTYKG